MTFPFKDVFKTSWFNILHYKKMWIIGVLISGASIFLEYTPEEVNNFFGAIGQVGIKTWFLSLLKAPTFLLLIVLGFVLAVGLGLLSLLASASLISAIRQIKDNSKADIKSNIKFGLSRFVPMILETIIVSVPLFVMFVLMQVFDNYKLFFLSSLTTILMFVYALFVFLFQHFTYCYIVLEQHSPWAAIKAGLQLFSKNWQPIIVVHLINLGLIIAFFVANFLVAAIVAIPFILVGAVLILFSSWSLPLVTIVIGMAVYGIVAIVMSGIRSSFSYSLFTHTYWRLR
ncbi:hypothetical protein COT97_02560 [Candidatus Falkowbacteria bacterium CG10_big_fil_rev_8_21_14_0_10_39_11]|uniref:Glycerophosphoryl diester phosphodiesterase membrane domain-containing protein n=1 Tax=Candidatus Falkowbacteria bacterium CG10_big_fil_rev_8_21_14_0_10_39_11 TaxID=1974565 RepID=A0A2H0V585_9BACT|nr:MAG: hypothetical protein COT97_02560 [Candidatus Falkowbacteria bacterium CG10_big_fil_rev_8_21_14_0_10_39_11]